MNMSRYEDIYTYMRRHKNSLALFSISLTSQVSCALDLCIKIRITWLCGRPPCMPDCIWEASPLYICRRFDQRRKLWGGVSAPAQNHQIHVANRFECLAPTCSPQFYTCVCILTKTHLDINISTHTAGLSLRRKHTIVQVWTEQFFSEEGWGLCPHT